MFPPENIRSALLNVLGTGVKKILHSSKTAREFGCDASQLSRQVLIRHLIEHVHRIRSFRPLDAIATQILLESHPAMAAVWAGYARSEAVHDRYFLRDLAVIGLNRTIIDATTSFPSTKALIKFVNAATREFGPLPIILYSFWAEENSDVGSTQILDRLQDAFGAQAVRGASAHRRLDETLDHAGVISDVLAAIIRTSEELRVAAGLLDDITYFIGAYFADLDDWHREGRSVEPQIRVSNAPGACV